MSTIEEARTALDDALVTPSWADRPAIMQAADAYALAVLEEAVDVVLADLERAVASPQQFREGIAGGTRYAALRARIAPQPHGEPAAPPQEEG